MRAQVTRCCALLAATAALLAPAVPAQATGPAKAPGLVRAAGPAARVQHPAALVLTLTPQTGPESEVTLTCDPAGGTHPRAEDACAKLAAAGGDFLRLTPTDEPCTLEYAPVRAHVAGAWRGGLMDYVQTFPNRCAAATWSDHVLDF
ncbi:SSI family serine proteinase inhibitor [Longispora sp. K20-0274]|uniref:SSI family serine proteinase inhibitor n=1 Tax=Longispora sp. K20-0274 TaxID=3088255 RepID=UPI003999AFC7